MKEFEWPSGVTSDQRKVVAQVLWVLHEHGPVKDPESGRAAKLLLDLLAERGADYSHRIAWFNHMLADMDGASAGPKFGRLIRRERSATRTQSIALAINPNKHPFPPSPFPPAKVLELEPEPEPEPQDEEVGELIDFELESELVEDDEAPGTDLVPADDGHISVVDRLLYAQSAISEAIDQVVAERVEVQHADLVQGMHAFERLVRENEELRAENRSLHQMVRQLRRAVQQRR